MIASGRRPLSETATDLGGIRLTGPWPVIPVGGVVSKGVFFDSRHRPVGCGHGGMRVGVKARAKFDCVATARS